MSELLISNTEPPKLRAIGKVTTFPERYGVDVCWRGQGGWCGVQRKEVSDLLASVRDGRLGMQLRQMAPLKVAIVMVEGKMRWTGDGELIQSGKYTNKIPWTRKQINGVLYSIQSKGVWVQFTENVDETVQAVQLARDWTAKESHTGLESRSGPETDTWGNVSRREWQRHILMGLPGIGRELADRILSEVGFPLTFREGLSLKVVNGLGPKRIAAIEDCINGDHPDFQGKNDNKEHG